MSSPIRQLHALAFALGTICAAATAQSSGMPCGTYDDGGSEHAFGLTSGGEIGWLHGQECLQTIERVETAYGTPTGSPIGNPPPNGNGSRIVCYEDPDCDRDPRTPAGGMTILWSVATVTTNTGTNILNPVPAPAGANTSVTSGCSFVMATADHAASEIPAPMDLTNPTPKAWVVGETTGPGSMDVAVLVSNGLPPLQMRGLGLPTAWLLRAHGTEVPNDPYPPSCFGDGAGPACGCGNDGAAGEGCMNSTGSGARIAGTGMASLSNDSFVLTITQLPDTPGLTFQGDVAIANPPSFGDGVRCCGMNLVRWITIQAVGGCAATDLACGQQLGGAGGPISQHPGNAGLMAGDSRCYQHWYRDPGPANPCGVELFNLSPAVVASWGP